MAILVIAEHDNKTLQPSTLNTITAAIELSEHGAGEISVLVAGKSCSGVSEEAANMEKIVSIIQADSPSHEHALAENLANLVVGLAKDYGHILAPATTFGKNFLPRVAALLDTQQISEISEVINEETFVRPIYAGNAMATVKSRDTIKVISVRSTAFEQASKEGGNAEIITIDSSDVSDVKKKIEHILNN